MVGQFGSVAEIQRHCGWTGNVETSWKTVSGSSTSESPASKTLAQIDGTDSILYWVDLTTEMAFYLPHQFSGQYYFASFDVSEFSSAVCPSRYSQFWTAHLDCLAGRISRESRFSAPWYVHTHLDQSLWTHLFSESQTKSRDISIIGIHPLKNHLYRILLDSNAQRSLEPRFSLSLSRVNDLISLVQNAIHVC